MWRLIVILALYSLVGCAETTLTSADMFDIGLFVGEILDAL
jgi:hypothetical protein